MVDGRRAFLRGLCVSPIAAVAALSATAVAAAPPAKVGKLTVEIETKFSRDVIVDLIKQINAAQTDGHKLNVG